MTSEISLRRRPDVLEEHVVAVVVLAERLGLEVEVHGAGERVGDDQRRGGQVVHLHVGGDAALEVAVAREHRGHREVVVVDGLRDGVRQRTGVADAGGAAVADQEEAQLLQVRPDAGLVVVVADHLRARRHRRLDPRLGGQALLDGVAGQQRGAEHHRRVGGVGARRDGRDDDGAVVEHELALLVGLHRDRLARPALGAVGRREATSTASSSAKDSDTESLAGKDSSTASSSLVHSARVVLLDVVVDVLAERDLGSDSRIRSCGRFGPGDRRHHVAEVELEVLGERRARGSASCHMPCALAYASTSASCSLGAAGQPQVVDGDRRRSGRSLRWNRIRGSCCPAWRGWPAAPRRHPRRRTRRTCRPRRACAASR